MRIAEIPPNEFHHAAPGTLRTLSQAEYPIFLSQDAIPEGSNWLASLLKNFSDSEVGAVYGRQPPRHETTSERHSALSAIYGPAHCEGDRNKRQLGFAIITFPAPMRPCGGTWAATAFRRSESFRGLGIAKRILDAGWKIVYEPDARVLHSHDHSTVGLFKRYFDIGYTFRRLESERTNARFDDRRMSSMIKQKFGRPKIRDARRLDAVLDVLRKIRRFLAWGTRTLPAFVRETLPERPQGFQLAHEVKKSFCSGNELLRSLQKSIPAIAVWRQRPQVLK